MITIRAPRIIRCYPHIKIQPGRKNLDKYHRIRMAAITSANQPIYPLINKQFLSSSQRATSNKDVKNSWSEQLISMLKKIFVFGMAVYIAENIFDPSAQRIAQISKEQLYLRNRQDIINFQGRDDSDAQLTNKVSSQIKDFTNDFTQLTHTILQGSADSGKSYAAKHFVKQHLTQLDKNKEKHPFYYLKTVVSLSSYDREILELEYMKFAEQLGLTIKENRWNKEKSLADLKVAVNRELAWRQNWVIIFDKIQSAEIIADLIPKHTNPLSNWLGSITSCSLDSLLRSKHWQRGHIIYTCRSEITAESLITHKELVTGIKWHLLDAWASKNKKLPYNLIKTDGYKLSDSEAVDLINLILDDRAILFSLSDKIKLANTESNNPQAIKLGCKWLLRNHGHSSNKAIKERFSRLVNSLNSQSGELSLTALAKTVKFVINDIRTENSQAVELLQHLAALDTDNLPLEVVKNLITFFNNNKILENSAGTNQEPLLSVLEEYGFLNSHGNLVNFTHSFIDQMIYVMDPVDKGNCFKNLAKFFSSKDHFTDNNTTDEKKENNKKYVYPSIHLLRKLENISKDMQQEIDLIHNMARIRIKIGRYLEVAGYPVRGRKFLQEAKENLEEVIFGDLISDYKTFSHKFCMLAKSVLSKTEHPWEKLKRDCGKVEQLLCNSVQSKKPLSNKFLKTAQEIDNATGTHLISIITQHENGYDCGQSAPLDIIILRQEQLSQLKQEIKPVQLAARQLERQPCQTTCHVSELQPDDYFEHLLNNLSAVASKVINNEGAGLKKGGVLETYADLLYVLGKSYFCEENNEDRPEILATSYYLLNLSVLLKSIVDKKNTTNIDTATNLVVDESISNKTLYSIRTGLYKSLRINGEKFENIKLIIISNAGYEALLKRLPKDLLHQQFCHQELHHTNLALSRLDKQNHKDYLIKAIEHFLYSLKIALNQARTESGSKKFVAEIDNLIQTLSDRNKTNNFESLIKRKEILELSLLFLDNLSKNRYTQILNNLISVIDSKNLQQKLDELSII